MKKGGSASVLFGAVLLCMMRTTAYGSDDGLLPPDPILQELQKIAKEEDHPHIPERNASKTPAIMQQKSVSKTSNEHNLSVVLKPRIISADKAKDSPRNSSPLQTDPHPVTYDPSVYLALKTVPLQPADRVDPRRYLSLKEIIEPMPENYARTYLKMKTLLNPTRTYVIVHIDKARQQMRVYLDNDYIGRWKVSTARRGYWTPNGIFRPYTLERMHYSKKYHHSPMPWSVFFKGGYAIHGTHAIRHLGHPASHGCVRVHPRNAHTLYRLIRRYGMQNTRIIING
ncbi:L,D-transpeptidase [Nitratifractor sp.]|uniref:L,D-transpeptidase n=1 Tax=Nitratifractor sp. TaxID=2268144 RepID=UPI0025ED61D2|nr:L,D-transpeptidase [Nitratifractor sp.]